ncbi:MAG: proline--tRNA ligase, partial [Nitrososphaerota archaeon]|nr:proline--tRNA ligase [Nitrososphaerota archaeon]
MGPKKKSFSEWYDYVLKEGEFIDVRYGVKGMVVYRPRGMAIVSRLYQMFESDLKERGHQQVLFPLM